jgi:hypothetical protein
VKHKQLLNSQSLKAPLLTQQLTTQTPATLGSDHAATAVGTKVVVVLAHAQVAGAFVVVSAGGVHLLRKKLQVSREVFPTEKLELTK